MLSVKEKIGNYVKVILNNFVKSLEAVKDAKIIKDTKIAYRNEFKGQGCNIEFRNIMFENAPKRDDDCIISETKKWRQK